jgi:hypothetical protein
MKQTNRAKTPEERNQASLTQQTTPLAQQTTPYSNKELVSPKAGPREREKRNASNTYALRYAKRCIAEDREPIPNPAGSLGPREPPDTRHSVPEENHRFSAARALRTDHVDSSCLIAAWSASPISLDSFSAFTPRLCSSTRLLVATTI